MPRSSFARSRPALLGAGLGLAGLGLVGALAGCSAGGAGTAGPGSGGGPYRDGTYTADGSYQAPSGTETINSQLTRLTTMLACAAVSPPAISHAGPKVSTKIKLIL